MSMPRQLILYSFAPVMNRLPVVGQAIWYPLHGTYDAGLPPGQTGLPDLAPVIKAGSEAAGKWSTTSGLYTFPADNNGNIRTPAGAANSIGLQPASVDLDEETDYIDQVMSLTSSPVGSELVVFCDVAFVDQGNAADDEIGTIWYYGRAGFNGACNMGLVLSKTEVPQFHWRGVTSSTSSSHAMTAGGGAEKTFVDMKNQGRFSTVMSIYLSASLTLTTKLYIGHASVGQGTYTYTADLSDGGGTAPPGRNAVAVADWQSITLGCRPNTSTYDQFFGMGSGNTGKIGGFGARQYDTYDSARGAAVLADLLARPLEFPRTLLD